MKRIVVVLTILLLTGWMARRLFSEHDVAAPELAADASERGASTAESGVEVPIEEAALVTPFRKPGDEARSSEDSALRVIGRVTSLSGGGVGGALVSVFVAGQAPVVVRSADDGTFAARCPTAGPLSGGCVLARSADEVGVGSFPLLTDPAIKADVGSIELRPAASLRVIVSDSAVDVRRARWRFLGCELAEAAIDQGVGVLSGLPRGMGTVEVVAAAGVVKRASLVLREGEEEVWTISILPLREVSVRVVARGTKVPVVGARLRLEPNDMVAAPILTNQNGEARLFLGRDLRDPLVVVEADGFYPDYAPFAPDVAEFEVSLEPITTLRWHVDGQGEIPASGPLVVTSIDGDPLDGTRAHVIQGEVVIDNLRERSVTLSLISKDGFAATTTVDSGRALSDRVRFSLARRLTLRVPETLPLLEVRTLRGVVSPLDSGGEQAVVTFDRTRTATFAHLTATRYLVEVAGDGRVVDLTEGDKELLLSIPTTVTLEFAGSIDGRPGWPRRVDIASRDAILVEQSPLEQGVRARFRLRSPFTKVVVVTLRPEPELAAVTVSATVASEEVPLRLTVPFVSAATLHLVVNARAEQRFSLTIEQWDDGANSFNPTALRVAADSGDGHEFKGVTPATYRLRDRLSGMTSAPVALAPRGEGTLSLDLSGLALLSGEILAPADVSLRGTGVTARWLEDPDREPTLLRPRVDGRGFTLPTVPGRHYELRVTHPTLVPHGERGRVVVSSTTRFATLELTRGATLTFTAASHDILVGTRLPVYLVAPGEGFRRVAIKQDSGEFVIEGCPTGVFDVWIDGLPNTAPLCVSKFKVAEGETSLGVLAPVDGGRLHVVLNQPQDAPRRVEITVSRVGLRALSSTADSGGAALVPFPHLAEGEYRVVVIPHDGAGVEPLCDQQVSVKNGATQDLRVDLR